MFINGLTAIAIVCCKASVFAQYCTALIKRVLYQSVSQARHVCQPGCTVTIRAMKDNEMLQIAHASVSLSCCKPIKRLSTKQVFRPQDGWRNASQTGRFTARQTGLYLNISG